MGPRVPFAPALLTSSLLITLHIYFISSLLFILFIIRVMVNKAVKKNPPPFHQVSQLGLCLTDSQCVCPLGWVELQRLDPMVREGGEENKSNPKGFSQRDFLSLYSYL